MFSFLKNIVGSVFFNYLVVVVIFSVFPKSAIWSQKVVSYLIYPLQTVILTGESFVTDWGQDLVTRKKMSQVNDQLQKEIQKLKKIVLEQQRQKQAVFFQQTHAPHQNNYQYLSEIGYIISKDFSQGYKSFVIDIGSMQGIHPYDIATQISETGNEVLVGYVQRVYRHRSIVRTILHQDFQIGAQLSISLSDGVIHGMSQKLNMLEMNYIPKEKTIQLTERVQTSFLSRIAPPGILIGEVSQIDHTDPTQMEQGIFVKPYVDFSTLKYVYILQKQKTSVASKRK